MFDILEQRRLFAVSVQLNLNELDIVGTDQPETVLVSVDGSSLKIKALTGTGPIYVFQQWTFAAVLVTRIDARLNGGADSFESGYVDAEVDVRGGNGDDDFDINTDGRDINADGGRGDDIIRVSYGSFNQSTILGGDGDDSLFGGLGTDRIFGQYGSDLVVGGDGSDWIYGEHILSGENLAGNDTLVGGFGNDLMDGGPGDDLLTKWFDLSAWGESIYAGDGGEMHGSLGNDILDATGANANGMELFGGYGNDELIGSDGGDSLDGGFGEDTLRGNAGDDTYYADDGFEDRIEHTTGGGNETIFNDMLDILV